MTTPAPLPSGHRRPMGAAHKPALIGTDGKVHLGKLDCDGALVGGHGGFEVGRSHAWLSKFSGSSAASKTINTGVSSSHPHLVAYGTGRMLLAWQSGSSMLAQVYDAGTGAEAGGQLKIAVKDHNYQAFKPYADGSAAYPAAGASSRSIKVARVLPVG